jgi:PKD repeat protein
MQIRKLSTLDRGYKPGRMSQFPQQLDNRDSLFYVRNNAETVLKQSLTFSSKYIVVEDASQFPSNGLIKITPSEGIGEPEIVYYGIKIGNQFHQLQRGFAQSRQSSWAVGSIVSLPVMADHHNALKDAIIKIQERIGLKNQPDPGTINADLVALEKKWLSPHPSFKAYPRAGPAPLAIRFQNLSVESGFSFLWDFGDGTNSTERNPLHIFQEEGTYNVKLTMVSQNGASGLTHKPSYITVKEQDLVAFFYIDNIAGISQETAGKKKLTPTNFELVDQTNADIVERHWFFGDGKEFSVDNPNNHSIHHIFAKPGQYRPTLLLRLSNNKLMRAAVEILDIK